MHFTCHTGVLKKAVSPWVVASRPARIRSRDRRHPAGGQRDEASRPNPAVTGPGLHPPRCRRAEGNLLLSDEDGRRRHRFNGWLRFSRRLRRRRGYHVWFGHFDCLLGLLIGYGPDTVGRHGGPPPAANRAPIPSNCGLRQGRTETVSAPPFAGMRTPPSCRPSHPGWVDRRLGHGSWMRRWAGIVLCCPAAMESALRRWLLPAVLGGDDAVAAWESLATPWHRASPGSQMVVPSAHQSAAQPRN